MARTTSDGDACFPEEVTRLFVRISEERKTSLDIDIDIGNADIRTCDVAILKTVPFHMAEDIQHDVDKYLETSRRNFAARGEARFMPIVQEVATPIYLVTVLGKARGCIAYVGKTLSKNNRFAGGHAVAMKLHDPNYDSYGKFISFATIVLSTVDHERFPVEWIASSGVRRDIIGHVEHALIWKFQPELNDKLKKAAPTGFGFPMDFNGASDDHVRIANIRVRVKDGPIVQLSPDVCPAPRGDPSRDRSINLPPLP